MQQNGKLSTNGGPNQELNHQEEQELNEQKDPQATLETLLQKRKNGDDLDKVEEEIKKELNEKQSKEKDSPSTGHSQIHNSSQSDKQNSTKGKRGRKKGKGKELQDLLEQYQDMQKGSQQSQLSVAKQRGKKASQANANSHEETKNYGQADKVEFLDTKTRPKRNTSPTKFYIPDVVMSVEEERMLKLAIKNSLIQSQNSISTLDDIPEVKAYHPTDEEFINPINYIEKLFKEGAAQFGIIKIIPPKSFRPVLAFDQLSTEKLPCRYQVLQELAQGKPFNQNNEGHTFAELAQMSRKLETEQTVEEYWQLEKDYWNKVDNQIGPTTQVEYAADLNVTIFGSGFHRQGQTLVDQRQRQYTEHPWNLNNMYKNPNSLMQFPRSRDISGINVPWLYVGMKYSSFCWHYEDLMLYSINYNHWGKPKLWYGVPEDQKDKFEKAIKSKVALLFKKDPNILLDIITMVSPVYLHQQKIKVYKTLQMPGEFVLTFPGAYHAGFSTGLNIGEAVNFVSRSWFDYGLKCQEIYRKSREKIPVFPIDWLIVENISNLKHVKLDRETKLKLREEYSRLVKDEIHVRQWFEQRIAEVNQAKQDFNGCFNMNGDSNGKAKDAEGGPHSEEVEPTGDKNDHEDPSEVAAAIEEPSEPTGTMPGPRKVGRPRKQVQKAVKGKNQGVYQLMDNRDKVPYDAHQCFYCTDFAYLSIIYCKTHKRNYCLQHQLICGCTADGIQLTYRYSTKELLQLEKDINEACGGPAAMAGNGAQANFVGASVKSDSGNKGQSQQNSVGMGTGAGVTKERIKKKIFKNVEEVKTGGGGL